jgi:hypothetical protein
MAVHLTQEWLELRRELTAGLPERTGASACLQHVVAGGPDGPVTYVETFEDGRLTSATLGPDPAADLTINLTHPDAVLIARGELDLHAGFMQGRVKVVGPMGRFMAVLPATQSPEHRAAVAALAEQTEI